jgi:hypothetical protein
MKPCRECQHEILEQAFVCPNCGAPNPALDKWDGWGFEYKSKAVMFGLPLVHISFKYRPNRVPVVAQGILAIGQFAYGFVTISQFGIGLISLSQFTVAWYALAQFAVGHSILAQIGLYMSSGRGQLVTSFAKLMEWIG